MPQVETCAMCGIKLLTPHPVAVARTRGHPPHNQNVKLWILPESKHDALVKGGLASRNACKEAFVFACYMCSHAAAKYFTEEERAMQLNSPLTLRNALVSIGWRKKRVSSGFGPNQLAAHKEDFRRKNFTFKDVMHWPRDEDLNALVSRGEAIDMFSEAKRTAEAYSEQAKAQIKDDVTATAAGIRDDMKTTEEHLEALQKRFQQVEQKVDENTGAGEDISGPEVLALARTNKDLLDLVRRDLKEYQVDWEAYKTEQQEADERRDEQLRQLQTICQSFKEVQKENRRMKARLETLEWKVVATPSASEPPTTADGKGKGKRKRAATTVAQLSPAPTALATAPEAVIPRQTRKIQTRISDSSSDDDSSDESPARLEEATSTRPQPAKKARIEIEVQTRQTASQSELPAEVVESEAARLVRAAIEKVTCSAAASKRVPTASSQQIVHTAAVDLPPARQAAVASSSGSSKDRSSAKERPMARRTGARAHSSAIEHTVAASGAVSKLRIVPSDGVAGQVEDLSLSASASAVLTGFGRVFPSLAREESVAPSILPSTSTVPRVSTRPPLVPAPKQKEDGEVHYVKTIPATALTERLAKKKRKAEGPKQE